ncbi:hypothetical protein ACE1TI_09965 [Alteribacillus sp. JSM 102045]|uniref:hypothetical protein n=1 Tax=Alteribacillus sp. JSM 102045 TaxID=1562101 RepID=UPI0035BF4A14
MAGWFGRGDIIFEEIPEPVVTYDVDLSMGEGISFRMNNEVLPDTSIPLLLK